MGTGTVHQYLATQVSDQTGFPGHFGCSIVIQSITEFYCLHQLAFIISDIHRSQFTSTFPTWPGHILILLKVNHLTAESPSTSTSTTSSAMGTGHGSCYKEAQQAQCYQKLRHFALCLYISG